MTGVVGRVRHALPDSLAGRARWLFAAFTIAIAGLYALPILAAGGPNWLDDLIGVAGLAVVAGWAAAQYRAGGLPPWCDPIPAAGLLVAGVAAGSRGAVLGPMLGLLFVRPLYGSPRRVAANAVGYFAAYQAIQVVTSGWPSLWDVSVVVVGAGVAVITVIMLLLADVIQKHERDLRRGEVLARAASSLQRARSHDEVYAAAVAAGLELVHGEPDAVVALWRGDRRTLRVEGRGGAVPGDVPPHVAFDILPGEVQEALLAGEPFVMSEQATVETQKVMGMAPPWLTSCIMVPSGRGETFAGMLTAASTRPLPPDLTGPLERLGADVGLALELADRTLLLDLVVDNSSDAILHVGDELTIGFASSAIRAVLGHDPERVLGHTLVELFVDEGDDVRTILDEAARASVRRDPVVVSMRHRDGSARRIELATTPLSAGRQRGWVINLRDVTRRIEAEHRLEDSEQRFRSLAESVSEGLYRMTLRPGPRYEYVNPAMEAMLGVPAAVFLADPDVTFRHIHPDHVGYVERTRSSPETVEWPVELRWHHPEHGWRWLQVRETVVRDDAGEAVSTMGIVSDITGHKQQEEALHSALEQERVVTDALRKVDTMRTTFLQAVSHELRTPLTTIVGFSQTLNRAGDRLDDARRADMLERLEVNARKLEQLLSDLLDVDRLSSGAIEPTRRPVDVAGLCRRVLEQTPTPTHPVSGPDNCVIANVDSSKVERIVVNLLGNAVKHTPAGTPITIHVVPDEAGDGAILTVEDDGPGIPEELHDTVFDAFVQGPASSSSPQPGTGIGLSLVARFAELHGGRAWLEEPTGGGCRFQVHLPADAAVSPDPVEDGLAAGRISGPGR